MIPRTKEFEKDIKELKKLSAQRYKDLKKYGYAYKVKCSQMMKTYGVSLRTLQKWIVAKTPWVRDKRDDAGKPRVKIGRKAEAMLHEAIESGKKKGEAQKIVESKLGKKISVRKRDQVLKKSKPDNADSAFGSEAREFFRKLFDLDLIPPDKGMKLKYSGNTFVMTKADLEDVCRVIANAYNRYAEAQHSLKFSRAAFRKQKLWQLYDEAVTKIDHGGVNIQDLKEISLFIQRLEIDRNKINPRVQTMFKIIQHYSPDVTLDEVISLAEEYEGVFD